MAFRLVKGDEYVGRHSIRQGLNDSRRRVGGHVGDDIRASRRRRGYGTEILRLELTKAQRLGLTRVVLTCHKDNVGSRRIIERNGGQWEDAVAVAD